jgi:hypothetical protein
MNRNQVTWLGMVVMAGCLGVAAGCAQPTDAGAGAAAVEVDPGATVAEGRIETALRDVETGRNLPAARGVLEQALGDEAITSDQRDDARLALSRLYELQGDKEAAIRAVEELLGSYRAETRFASRDLAERRLRKLLTGDEAESPSHRNPGEVAPIAGALASFFAKEKDGTTRAQVLIFGRSPEEGRHSPMLNFSGALQEKRREECPLCTDSVGVNSSVSQVSSWVSIPAALAANPETSPSLGSSLVIYYYDLETNRIPSRYDAHLPMPSEAVARRLEAGEGLIAVRVREGAPPLVLLAAPRWAMLSEVEKAFAQMRELPKEPTPVVIDNRLRSTEIQSVVRSAYPKLRACYETHVAAVPDAEGKIVMGFSIDAEGRAQDVKATEDSTLQDAQLQRCFVEVFGTLTFPAAGKNTTVTYPIALSPSRDRD